MSHYFYNFPLFTFLLGIYWLLISVLVLAWIIVSPIPGGLVALVMLSYFDLFPALWILPGRTLWGFACVIVGRILARCYKITDLDQ